MSEEGIILEVKETKTIEEGKHKGVIANMVYETRKDFAYIDIYIDLQDGNDITIKTGFPANISEKSTFGRFLMEAGLDVIPGQKIELKAVKKRLVGKTIEFTTYNDDNDFARVVNKTIKFV